MRETITSQPQSVMIQYGVPGYRPARTWKEKQLAARSMDGSVKRQFPLLVAVSVGLFILLLAVPLIAHALK